MHTPDIINSALFLRTLAGFNNNLEQFGTMTGFVARLEEATRWFPAGMSREERSLVRKLDLLVLPYACLSFFVKYLDVSALSMLSLDILDAANIASECIRIGDEGRPRSGRRQAELYQRCL